MIDVVCGVCIIDGQCLIAQRKHKLAPGFFEFPGGKVEEGENHKEALLREFQEEFMIDIEVGECIATAEFKHKNNTVSLFAYEIFVKDIDNVSWILSEHTDVNWVPFDKISELEFVDSDLLLLEQIRNYYGL
jgi:8-oxo-dGTP diphosphatase